MQHRISSAKNELVTAEEFVAKAVSPMDKKAALVFPRYQARLHGRQRDGLRRPAASTRTGLLSEYPGGARARTRSASATSASTSTRTPTTRSTAITNLLAAGHRNLMVVGDDDQSIYSWRGADLRNILEFEHDYPQAVVVKLEQNYRSTARILAAANAVVANNPNRKPKTLFTANAEGEKISSYLASDERDEARFIAAEIERLLRAEDRRYTDFAVFYRTNAQSRQLEDALLRAGVPYRIVGGTRFFDRAEIRDVMAYLKAVVNPADEISLKRIINTPKRNIGATTVERVDAVARERDIGFEDALRLAVDDDMHRAAAQTAIAGFVALIDELRTHGRRPARRRRDDRRPRAASSRRSKPSAPTRPPAVPRTSASSSASSPSSRPRTKTPDLPAFMEWLALRTDLDSLGEGDEYVTLMTVHTAKGLEYPVVFVAGLEESIFPHQNSIFDSDGSGLEEERRLAYVAITRARERLYLSHAHARSIYGSTQHNPPSRFIGEIPSECVSASGVGSLGVSGSGWEKRGDRGGSFGHGAGSGGRVYGSGAPALTGTGFGSAGVGKKKPTQPAETFAVGDAVDHKAFGRGSVVSVKGDALEIRFERTGETKKLLVGYAPIVKIRS